MNLFNIFLFLASLIINCKRVYESDSFPAECSCISLRFNYISLGLLFFNFIFLANHLTLLSLQPSFDILVSFATSFYQFFNTFFPFYPLRISVHLSFMFLLRIHLTLLSLNLPLITSFLFLLHPVSHTYISYSSLYPFYFPPHASQPVNTLHSPYCYPLSPVPFSNAGNVCPLYLEPIVSHILHSKLFFFLFVLSPLLYSLLLSICNNSPSLFTSYIQNSFSFSLYYLPLSIHFLYSKLFFFLFLPPFLLCLYSLHCSVITTLPVMLSNDFCFLYFASIVSNSSFPSLYFIPLSFQLLLPTYFLLNISSISSLTHSHSGNTHLYSFTSFFS
ncbi:unnamed protein product [Acanthosepion pharaonis]|uniref:Uncharacterized protein n=1 Tax=Acanthosepion pharaonis TaxID=158019 RepID=A0A812CYV3_ACAPH|nr:unnamed protein product [Sepia pharaonis]